MNKKEVTVKKSVNKLTVECDDKLVFEFDWSTGKLCFDGDPKKAAKELVKMCPLNGNLLYCGGHEKLVARVDIDNMHVVFSGNVDEKSKVCFEFLEKALNADIEA